MSLGVAYRQSRTDERLAQLSHDLDVEQRSREALFDQGLRWTEILRRDIQFLSFPEAADTRHVARLQFDIAKCFLSDGYGDALMIWADEQRAIGEQMIVEEHRKVLCMGYANFRGRCDESLRPWCDRLRDELPAEAAQHRLRDVQHLLCELVETLDAGRVRYTDVLERA